MAPMKKGWGHDHHGEFYAQGIPQSTSTVAPDNRENTKPGRGQAFNASRPFRTAQNAVSTRTTDGSVPTSVKQSSFLPEPITVGPFDKNKYTKKMMNAATATTTWEHALNEHDGGRISTARASRTPEPNTSIPRSGARQGGRANPAAPPEPAQTSAVAKAEAMHSHALEDAQQGPKASEPIEASNSWVQIRSKPDTRGRPFAPQSQARVDYNVVELPGDRLRRIQQAAKIQTRIDAARRGNKHDTASPEVLAYIRKQLDPHLVEIVNRRIHHYWSIGNDNIPANKPSEAEPDWPPGLHEPEPAHSTIKFSQPKAAIIGGVPPLGQANRSGNDRKNNARWATRAEVRAPAQESDSNAWGSGSSNGTATDTHDSVRVESGGDRSDVEIGSAIHGDTGLVGWDGKIQPPPVDWAARPRFDNTSIDHMNHINNWGNHELDSRVSFDVIPTDVVLDMCNHADGLGFAPATETISERNATFYGYKLSDPEFVALLRACVPVSADDLKGEATLQLDDAANNSAVDETTEILVQRWIAQNGWLKSMALQQQQKTQQQQLQLQHVRMLQQRKKKAPWPLEAPSHYHPAMVMDNPKVRVALRPATLNDLAGMTAIYNWYVKHSPRPSELDIIEESEMQKRVEEVQGDKLPIIVAVARSRWRGVPRGDGRQGRGRGSHRNAHSYSPSQPSTHDETILGWACASDFGAPHYVERTSAECEIYVSRDGCHLGIGTALMDKLLEACDRGYIPSQKFEWHCPSEQQHLYSGGGGRELHKICFLVKKFHAPVKADKQQIISEYENDWDDWLKKWLESHGFKQEAVLSKIGAKNGRFIDIIYMTRETMWQPQDGHIPDPLAGTY